MAAAITKPLERSNPATAPRPRKNLTRVHIQSPPSVTRVDSDCIFLNRLQYKYFVIPIKFVSYSLVLIFIHLHSYYWFIFVGIPFVAIYNLQVNKKSSLPRNDINLS